MATPDPRQELLEQLRLVDDELAALERDAKELRRVIGERWEEPTDSAERSAEITEAEELEALVETLQLRRRELRRRLEDRTDATTSAGSTPSAAAD
jgi:hypothetical protein